MYFHFLDCDCIELEIKTVSENPSSAESKVVGTFKQLENKYQAGFPRYEYNNINLFYNDLAGDGSGRWTTSMDDPKETQQLRSVEGKACPDQIGSFWQFGSDRQGWKPESPKKKIFEVACSEYRPEASDDSSIAEKYEATTEASEDTDNVGQENCQNNEDAKLLILTLQELVEQIKMDTVSPSLPSTINNATSSEDLKSLEPPSEAQDKEGPKRFVFAEMKDFSPKGSFGFLAVNSSYKAIFPQEGGTEVKVFSSTFLVTIVIPLLLLKIIITLKGWCEDGNQISEQRGQQEDENQC